MSVVLLIIGIIFLSKGANWFVDGSVVIARKFKIPNIVIGLTLVAFGTSAPEAAVSINAAFDGSNGITLGNVIGSNLFNLLFVLGIAALLKPINIHLNTLRQELPFMLFTSLIALFLMFELNQTMVLSKYDGLVLLVLFLMYMYSMFNMMKSDQGTVSVETSEMVFSKSIIITILGLAAIIIGADFTVKGAVAIAQYFGLSEMLIGLTIISVGTSLPELITSIAAAKKGESDIAVGNIVGSNIFNLLFVLGSSASIHEIKVSILARNDMAILLVASLIAFVMMYRKNDVSRTEGGLLVLMYVLYLSYRIWIGIS